MKLIRSSGYCFRNMKTHFYEKPISQELAALIREAIHYTEERYGKCKYIFTNENDHTKPMTYSLIQGRITAAIHRENLRDDNGNYFTFGTHMYRHVTGRLQGYLDTKV